MRTAMSGFGRHKVVRATATELKQGRNKRKVPQGLWKTTVMTRSRKEYKAANSRL